MKKVLVVLMVLAVGSVAQAGLLAYWSFEEGSGTATADVTGNGNTASFEGSVGWSPDTNLAHSTQSLDFTGGRVNAGTLSNVDTHTVAANDWALSMWFKQDSILSDRGLIAKRVGWPANWEILLYGTNMNMFTTSAGWIGGFSVPDTDWHHMAFSVESGMTSIYLDGVQQGSSVAWGTLGTGQNMYIGANNNYANWDGHVDDVAIFDAALSIEEIGALAAGANPAGGGDDAVPEPATLALVALGALGLVVRRR